MNINTIILIGIFALLLLISWSISIYSIIILKNVNKELEYKRNINTVLSNLNYKVSDDDMTILDKIIEEERDKYILLKFEFQNNLYIKEDMQNEMIRIILTKVMERISPIVYEKLKYIYNQNVLEDIICEKVKFSVMDYAIKVNGGYNDEAGV